MRLTRLGSLSPPFGGDFTSIHVSISSIPTSFTWTIGDPVDGSEMPSGFDATVFESFIDPTVAAPFSCTITLAADDADPLGASVGED